MDPILETHVTYGFQFGQKLGPWNTIKMKINSKINRKINNLINIAGASKHVQLKPNQYFWMKINQQKNMPALLIFSIKIGKSISIEKYLFLLITINIRCSG